MPFFSLLSCRSLNVASACVCVKQKRNSNEIECDSKRETERNKEKQAKKKYIYIFISKWNNVKMYGGFMTWNGNASTQIQDKLFIFIFPDLPVMLSVTGFDLFFFFLFGCSQFRCRRFYIIFFLFDFDVHFHCYCVLFRFIIVVICWVMFSFFFFVLCFVCILHFKISGPRIEIWK